MKNSTKFTCSSAAVVVAAFLAVGCSTATGQSSGDAPAEPQIAQAVNDRPEGTAPARPVDAYSLNQSDSGLIFQAREKLLIPCMKDKGFEYKSRGLPQESGSKSNSWAEPDTLGLISSTAAAQTGYHSPANSGKTKEPGTGTSSPESEEYRIALTGSGHSPNAGPPKDKGCEGVVNGKMNSTGQPVPNLNLPDDLRTKSLEASMNDSRVKSAISSWSDCMGKHGYKYHTPVEAFLAAWPDPVGGSEIDTAKADMGCKKEAKLLGTWDAVISAYQTSFIKKNESALQGLKEYYANEIAHAKSIISGG